MKKTSRHRYEVVLYWSDEDQAYIAEVPELAWCAADGATHQEAIANVAVVIDEWIATARDKGRTIPEPKGRRLLVILPRYGQTEGQGCRLVWKKGRHPRGCRPFS